MPKLKTHRGAKKRVKLTSRGKLLRRRAFGSHFLTKKRPARKRRYAKEYKFETGDAKRTRKALGI